MLQTKYKFQDNQKDVGQADIHHPLTGIYMVSESVYIEVTQNKVASTYAHLGTILYIDVWNSIK